MIQLARSAFADWYLPRSMFCLEDGSMVKEPMFDARYIARVQQAEQVAMSREVDWLTHLMIWMPSKELKIDMRRDNECLVG